MGEAAAPVGIGPVRTGHDHVCASKQKADYRFGIIEHTGHCVHPDIIGHDDAPESHFVAQQLLIEAASDSVSEGACALVSNTECPLWALET